MTTINESPVLCDLDFNRNGKQISYIRVPYSLNSSAWKQLMVPIAVIKNGEGPTVFFNGGSHGGEYEGPVSLLKLIHSLDPTTVSGRIVVIPSLNLPAVLAGKRLSPIDGRDMNRVFPGDPRGSVSQVLAHYVHEAILSISHAVVDLHSGGESLNLLPYMSMHPLEDPAQAKATEAALEAFQAPVHLVIREFTGEGLLDYAVEKQGKVFLCAELGGCGMITPDTVQVGDFGVRNLLKHFGLVKGAPVKREELGLPPSRRMEIDGPAYYTMAEQEGIFEPFVRLGDPVPGDGILGQIHQAGSAAQEPFPVYADRGDCVLGLRGPGLAERGDCIALTAREVSPC